MPWSAWTTRSPGRQRGQFGEEGVGALAALVAADQPVAEHVLLGQHRDVGRGEAVVERQHQQRRVALGAERFLPGADLLQPIEAMVLEQPGKPLASAGAVAREDDFLLVLPQLGGVL